MKLSVSCAGLAGFAMMCSCARRSVPDVVAASSDELVQYAAALEHCKEIGRDAGSYKAYEDCTKEIER